MQVYKIQLVFLFSIQVLYLATLSNSFITSLSLSLVDSLGFSIYKIRSSANRDSFASCFFFPIWMLEVHFYGFSKRNVGLRKEGWKYRVDSSCQSSVGPSSPVSLPVHGVSWGHPRSSELRLLTGAVGNAYTVSFPPFQGKHSSQATFVW